MTHFALRRACAGASLLACAGAWGQPALRTALVARDLQNPVHVTHAPGDYQRVFIVEQGFKDGIGRIRVLPLASRAVLPMPFLTVSPVTHDYIEQGLLGLAFHPQYATNGHFFVFYSTTINSVGWTVLERFTVSVNPNIADPLSGRIVLRIPDVEQYHQGGWIGFGPDGLGEFYISIALQDLAQMDAAFFTAATRDDVVEPLHHAVYSRVTNYKSALYRDFPDEVRPI